MAIKEHGIEYKVGADTGGAVSNLQKFEREFRQMLEQMGKSPKEIAAFRILAKEVERGHPFVSPGLTAGCVFF